MIGRLVRFSVARPLLPLVLVGLVAVGGAWAVTRLPVDAVPDITNVQVQVLTAAPALSPLEIEQQITFPVEVSLSGLPRSAEIRSISRAGLSAVTIVFEDGVDLYRARQLVFERLQQADIPPDVGKPEMGPISTGLGEIYQYELRPTTGGSTADPMALRTVQDWIVRRQLLTVPGLAEVNSFGGYEKQYQVRAAPSRLQAYGLTLNDVLGAVTRNNENVGGAYIEHGAEQYLLRGVGRVTSLDELRGIAVHTSADGVPVLLGDVAEVTVGPALRLGAVTADGEGEIVAGIALMLQGENARSVVERVKARIEQIGRNLPEGIQIVPFYDRTALVGRTVDTVAHNLGEGAVLVVLVLVLLLGNWRGALLVASIIPLSMLFAVLCMNATGISGNLMSLGALDFGLIVDGAVVMVENGVRRASQCHEGEDVRATMLSSCLEVARPVVFAVGIIGIVYLPILTLGGIEGKMFRPMAATVLFALAGSLLLSLTFVPAAMGFVVRADHAERETRLIAWMRPRYRRALAGVMVHRRLAVLAAFPLVGASLVLLPLLGSEFMPRLDEGSFAVEARLLPTVSLEQAVRTYSQAEQVLRSFPETRRVVSKIGSAEVATDPVGVEAADLFIDLRPRLEWKTASSRDELAEKMSAALAAAIPGASFSFSQPIAMRFDELIAGVRADVAVKVFGDDLEVLLAKADEIAAAIRRVPGAEDVRVEQVAGLQQLQIEPLRAVIARYGMSVDDVNAIVRSLVAGIGVGEVFEGERRFDLVVRLGEAGTDLERLRELTVVTPRGAEVPLGELADLALRPGPAQISRELGSRRIAVQCNVRGSDLGGFVAAAKRQIEPIALPVGYTITWGGQFENLARARKRLLFVVPLALALIFVMLFATFGSARQALLICTGVPFAIVGGVVALFLRSLPFSISAAVGFIALFGVAVLNGVVMVSSINQLRQQGLALSEAVSRGAESRLRPVLMTALVASLGFVPMALATSSGAEVQRPLATVVIGGLVTSTLLTLLLLPTIYEWAESRRTGLG